MDKQKDLKDLLIRIEDQYGNKCLGDSNCKIDSNTRKPEGFVEIYEVLENNKKKIIEKSNLVVYLGRETLAQLLTNINNPNVASGINDHLYWLGLGNGGVAEGDPFNPLPPTNLDTELGNDIAISATDSTCGDWRIDAYYKHPLDSITYETDIANDNSWIVLKVTTTIGAGDANGFQISEAGLYTAESDEPAYSPGAENFHLFSRVTFTSIVKTSARGIVFIWYLYF